jgi:DNA-binding HxlR family transcriptional regulator
MSLLPMQMSMEAMSSRFSLTEPEARTIDERTFDRLLKQPIRQAILRALLAREVMSFSEIKREIGLTDGNLSTHAQKLEAAGFITCTKVFKRRMPRTEYQLTAAGRVAVTEYMDLD